MGRTSASQCVAGPEPGLRKHVVLSVELGDAVLCWHLLWLPPRASAADSSAPTRVGGRPGPQCGPLRSPLCAAQTSVSGMPGREEERPCPAGWLLCRGWHANAAPSASTGLLPPPRPAPPSCPPRPPRHCWRRPPATSALGVGFVSSPCAPRQNARNLVEGLRLICPCAQCVVMSVQQSRCLINNY